ncbi:MAG: hypothetical protein Q7R33_01945 [Nitrosarchaeum sp.]|nr:hypothetical protein [Nitrosarchaeum sp.]
MTNSTDIINDYKLTCSTITSVAKKYNIKKSFVKKILRENDILIKTRKDICKEKRNVGIRRNPRYKEFRPTKWFFYDNIFYQGTWEFKFGLWLRMHNIRFNCHRDVRRFEYVIDNKKHFYCPDFYLLDEDKFIEIKGQFTARCREKMAIISKLYPDIKIEIYRYQELSKMGVLNINKELNLDLKLYESTKNKNILINDLMKRLDIKDVIYQYIVEKRPRLDIANDYNVRPGRIISSIIKMYLPSRHTVEYYKCLLNIFSDYILNDYRNSIDDDNSFRWLAKKYGLKTHYVKNFLQENKIIYTKKYEDIEKLVLNNFDEGSTIRQLSRAYNLNKLHIKRILDSNNRDRQTNYRKNCNKQKLFAINNFGIEIVNDLKNKMAIRSISKKYNIRRKIIYWIKQNEVAVCQSQA